MSRGADPVPVPRSSIMHMEPDQTGRARRNPLLRLVQLSAANKFVLAEALLILGLASLAIKLLPFRRTAALMQASTRGRSVDPEKRDGMVRQCRWAIERCADTVPWRAVCFQRGLALQLMLRRRGIGSILHYGVAQDAERGLRAHVWLEVGGGIVLGGEQAPAFARLASFPAAPRG